MPDGISIVIPYYEDPHLADCLRAVEAAWSELTPVRRDMVEIIVVDDGSSCSPEIADFSGPIRVLRMPQNRGVGAARNRGAVSARFNKVLFVDSDVCLSANYLESAFEIFSENPKIQILQSPYSWLPANSRASLFHHFMAITWYYDGITFSKIERQRNPMLVSGCCLFELEFFKNIGGFSERFSASGGEEFDILRRIPPGSITQDLRLLSFHYSDGFVRRFRKVFRRSRNYFRVVAMNPNFPSIYRRAVAMRGFLLSAMTGALFLSFVLPKVGASVYLLLAGVYVVANRSQFGFYLRQHSLRLLTVSLLFLQIEYTVACAGVLLSFFEGQNRAESI